MRQNYFKLILAIALCQLAGGVGSLFTSPAIDGWYDTIVRPSFSPPNWIFGPVWTTLFTLMGIALYLVWMRIGERGARAGIRAFMVQLVLNVAWSFFFFYLQSPAAAFFEIVLLWLAILWTAVLFFRVKRAAGYLMLPYLAWVTFAAILNVAIWQLN